VTAPAPLRVALDATPLIGQRTGVGEFCRGALGGLAGRPELDVRAFAVSWRRRSAIEDLLPAGVGSRQRPMPARPLHIAWRHLGSPPAEWFLGPLDVVHGTNFVVPPARAARVLTVHDLTVVHYPELCDGPTLAYPALIRRALGRGAFVHTPSKFVAHEVIEYFGALPERVRPVHSGVPERAGRAPADPGPPARFLPAGTERSILSLATAEPRKDLPLLVRAFDELAGSHPDVALVLAGPPGWGEAELAAAVEASAFAGRIVRPGWLDDASVAGLLGSASVLAYPSRYEGFGFPPLEAMARGVPVVATDAGALSEVVGDAARLVPVGDAEALAGAIAGVLDSPSTAAAMVEAGRRRARQFSWSACAEGLAALYRDVVAEQQPSGAAVR
jgi:glycosyltransferase involved in cell wall biosynthesis